MEPLLNKPSQQTTMAKLKSILKTTENNITTSSQHSQPLKDLMNVYTFKNLPTITI